MQVTYQLTERDYYDAMVAMRNRRKFTKWLLPSMLVLVLVSFAVLILGSLIERRMIDGLVPIGALCVFWVSCYWFQPRWWARRQVRTQRSARSPQTLTADAGGLRWVGEGSTSDVQWGNVVRMLESPGVAVLFFSEFSFIVIPKRAFAPGQLAEFRALLTEYVGQK